MLSEENKIRLALALGLSVDDAAMYVGTNSFENNAARVAMAISLLDKIDAVWENIAEISRQGNAVRVDEITVSQINLINLECRYGRQLVNRLSLVTNISVWSDVFSPSAPEISPSWRRGYP